MSFIVTKSLLYKIAAADPFSPDYGQSSIEANAAPPGSIEAKRQEQAGAETAEAEAQAKQQEAEVKTQQKAVQDAAREKEKLMQNQQKIQQDLMATRAEVDAYKARDAAKGPGLSPSFNATQKRMQDRVKSLGNASKQYQGALTLTKASNDDVADLTKWMHEYSGLRKDQQIDRILKTAGMNPPVVRPPEPRPVSSPAVVTDGTAQSTVPEPPTIPRPSSSGFESNAPSGPRPAEGYSSIQAPETFKPTDTATVANQWARQFEGGVAGMNDAQKAQFKNLVKQTPMDGPVRGQGTAGDAFYDHSMQFAESPLQYMEDNNGWLGANGLSNYVNDKYGEGSVGAARYGRAAKIGDFFKDTITQPVVRIAGGLMQGGMDVKRQYDQDTAGWKAKRDFMDTYGLQGKQEDLDAAVTAARQGASQYQGPRAGTAVKNIVLGTGGAALNVIGGGAALKGVAGGARALSGTGQAAAQGRAAAQASKKLLANKKFIGAQVGVGMANGLSGDGSSPAQTVAGATPSPPRPPAPVPFTPGTTTPAIPQMQTYGNSYNPGFGQNLNNYSGWANQNRFPAAQAYNYGGGFLGDMAQFASGILNQPNYQSFQSGQAAFRNRPSASSAMNSAMQAFGRQQMGNPNWNQYNPAALATYGGY